MTQPPRQLQAVAICYATAGALYLLSAFLVVWFNWPAWTASLPSSVPGSGSAQSAASYAAIAVGYGGLARLSSRFLSLGRWLRVATIAASLALTLWNVGGAVRLTVQGIPEALSMVSPPTVLGEKWGLALAYSLCTYLLCKNARSPRQPGASQADVVD